MAPSTETSIWLALRSRIETLSLSPTLPIAYPASTFEPSGAYLAVDTITIAPQRVLVGRGAHERNGSLAINYVAPIGQDIAVYTQVAGLIAAHFPDDLRLRYGEVCVRVTDYPHVQAGYRDGAWWLTPTIVNWQTFA